VTAGIIAEHHCRERCGSLIVQGKIGFEFLALITLVIAVLR